MQSMLALFDKKITYTKKNLTNLLIMLILPIFSVLLDALSFNWLTDSTDIIPLTLNMYKYPKILYSSNNELIGQKYRDIVEYFGIAERIASNASIIDTLLNFSMKDIVEYRNNLIISAKFNDTENNVTWANGFYSGSAMHSVPLTINLLSNSLIKTFAGNKYSIVVSRQKLPNTIFMTAMTSLPVGQFSADSLLNLFLFSTVSLFESSSLKQLYAKLQLFAVVFIFCSFFFSTVSLFVVHPLQETETKVKQLQRLTGVTS
ncbi:PREDICTED: uncharacterized protein LOC105460188, partial [Wasmannia auropunctata]|uniref:uncharacterized protein LOC105460188 n=1 Tax=Wasmannia auropunctata TaxID=64793 RepID=UPI0005EDA829